MNDYLLRVLRGHVAGFMPALMLTAVLFFGWLQPALGQSPQTQPERTNAVSPQHGQPPIPKDIPILQKWSGDYPVVHFNRLPDGQSKSPVGYIGDATIFATVWQALKPGEKVPEVDFSKNFIIFSRNVAFYNRISIFKISLKGGVVEILTIETRSALPIEDKVAMALAVIPRVGVKFIQTGNEQIPVSNNN